MTKQNTSDAEIAAFLANGGKIQKADESAAREIPSWVAGYLARCPEYTARRKNLLREILLCSEGSGEMIAEHRAELSRDFAHVRDMGAAYAAASGEFDPDSREIARRLGLTVTDYRAALREARIREKHGLLGHDAPLVPVRFKQDSEDFYLYAESGEYLNAISAPFQVPYLDMAKATRARQWFMTHAASFGYAILGEKEL